ncbi:PucR family transcriptional regulator [Brevibacterium senegalense]|uniref:PucR family transcriptional regulator n=1 Tax=Brevibacterium senegalense TaxID=1033736 RepID=UPI00030E91D9|nr:PucR family transcriptional regulator ligand-binding domain-containing protein [Brevibacterium senegalense]
MESQITRSESRADAVPAPVTVRSILHLDEIRGARPQVLSGSARLGDPVRWVHIAETDEVPSLLEGGELILSSGTRFRRSVTRTRDFLTRLDAAGAAGFIIEIVDEAGQTSEADRALLIEAVAGLELPVIVLAARARYVRVTQAAHRLLIGEQLARVERARHVHDVFTDLSLRGADEQLIVDTTAGLLGSGVVLEDATHRVLAFNAADDSPRTLLDGWPRTGSRQVAVGMRGRRWGRLVAPFADPDDDHAGEVLERAGQAITLVRMSTQNERDAHQRAADALIHELLSGTDLSEDDALVRARNLGLADTGLLTPIAIRTAAEAPAGSDVDLTAAQLTEQALRSELVAAAEAEGASAIVGGKRAGMLVGLVCVGRGAGRREDDGEVDHVLTRMFERLADAVSVEHTVGAGGAHDSLLDAGRELEQAAQVADIVATMSVRSRPFHRFADVRLRGLVAVLRDDPRMRTFAEAELGELLGDEAGDAGVRRGPTDLEVLEALLQEGGGKTGAARALGLSRPAVYARTQRLEERLGVSLEDAESRTALHTALLWWRTAR